jgi:CDP-paratose 2-epimerase
MRAPLLITGGAGFIGANLADRLLSGGNKVIVYDDLSRAGVENNLQWLLHRHGSNVEFELGDIRDAERVTKAVMRCSGVFHFAAQVAVTSSVSDPRTDFSINTGGTLNVLEAIRSRRDKVPIIYTSTNKVYGNLCGLSLEMQEHRYVPSDSGLRFNGVDERTPLNFHSPYGCSKGAADQYVLDYSRCYSIPACVFRMSCIYGPHQFGNEDQGWVAHFIVRALARRPIDIFGDGMQVRDILYIEDLLNAFELAIGQIARLSGKAFNVGGGPHNTVSLLELIRLIGGINRARPTVHFHDWRVGDQRYYVSNTRQFEAITGWRARVGVDDGVRNLCNWLNAHSSVDQKLQPALQGGGV